MQSVNVICSVLVVLCLCFIGGSNGYLTSNPLNAPDLPGFASVYKNIPPGSLIIPMDASLQTVDPKSGLLSLLPYGLVIRSLYANVSVSWAIQSGKPSSGADFTAQTTRASFSSIATASNAAAASGSWSGWKQPGSNTFYGGPFIILAQNVPKAIAAWNNWKSSPSSQFITVDPSVYDTVMVHYLTTSVVVDIRHTINSRPFVAVSNLDGNAPTQTAMLGCIYQNATRLCPRQDGVGWGAIFGNGAAGCKAFSPQDHAGLEFNIHYATYDCGSQVAALTSTTCLATFSEPHWEWLTASGPSYISAMKQFVAGGANFIAQCSSIRSYEDQGSNTAGVGTFMSSYGILPYNANDGINTGNDALKTITNYPDLPITQFVGPLSSDIAGKVPDWYHLFSASDDAPNTWTTPSVGTPTDAGYNNFQSTSFPLVTNIYDTRSTSNPALRGRNLYIVTGAKYNLQNPTGSNIFYIGGHTWAGVTTAGTENGRRVFLNAIIIPAFRPAACGFTFCTPGTACDPRNACETCTCDASGSGFLYTSTPGCCLSNANCSSQACTVCDSSSHKCVPVTGCCAPTAGITCTGACQACSVTSGQGTCVGQSGCCQKDSQCNSTSTCVHCVSNACERTPAPACCDSNSDCTGTCMACNTSHVCARKQPLTSCCLANSDCGANPCLVCDLGSNACVAKPGCCNKASDCGTSPCVDCVSNSCVRKDACCENSDQCGTCQQCSNSTNLCEASPDASCCVVDSDCGSCRRCSAGTGNSKTCTAITDCCLTSADCEVCQNCTANQCVPIAGCCSVDSQCDSCQVCEDYQCVHSYDLSCCLTTDDCYTNRDWLRIHSNNTGNITDCDLQCTKINPTDLHGACQAVCTTPKNYTGLIVGLAVGIPLGLLALLALAAIIGLIIYKKRDALTTKFVRKNPNMEGDTHVSPIHQEKISVVNSRAYGQGL